MTAPAVHWFRQDLRLADNPALSAAVTRGAPLVLIYVLDDETPGPWNPGGASRWWLHHSLHALAADIGALGGTLVLRRGPATRVLTRLVDEIGAGALSWTRCYEPHARRLDDELREVFRGRLELHREPGNLLFEPEAVRTGTGEPFRVFTPFWKACGRFPEPRQPLPAPTRIRFLDPAPGTEHLDDWGLLPSAPDWAGGLRETWAPGERGARERLEGFLERPVRDYDRLRDRPGAGGTSRLSPHLHFGELSPRLIWHGLGGARALGGGGSYLRELGWREFSYHILHHWPRITGAPLRARFERFPWRQDPDGLRAWQGGRTGYPLVDAGMRELWHTGWMHNRVRMVAASFLVKHLLVSWREGAAWFWDTLVDADLANNSASWQWVAGSGADAAPYFRIFNPVAQSRKFDPEGAYLRHWVPELRRMPGKWIHEPSRAPVNVLREGGVELDGDYPRPIVDHGEARALALAAFERTRDRR